jgi:predicted XRE-type DNA-binding protein
MTELIQRLEALGLKQDDAARRLGVSQPRISDLVRGKIGRFSVDTLIAMLGKAGKTVTITVR